MAESWRAILRIPYRMIGVGLTLAHQQRHDFKVNRQKGHEMAQMYGCSGFVPNEKGYPLGLAWRPGEDPEPEPGVLSAFSIRNEGPGRTAYLKGNAKLADRTLWNERAGTVPTYATDFFIAQQCGWHLDRHAVMSNSKVHFPVMVDCGGDEIFMTLPRQIGDGQDDTLKPDMLEAVSFRVFDTAYRLRAIALETSNG